MSKWEPWKADRELDADTVRRAVQEALPQLAPVEAALLGFGWDFDAYEVNGRWVFRFPRRAGEQDRLRKDLVFLEWLAPRVDAPVPRYRWGALSASAFPYVFSGYEKLEGRHAIEFDAGAVDLGTLGAWLGGFFRDLHALEVPVKVREAAGIEPRRRTFVDTERRLLERLPRFVEGVDGELAARAERYFRDASNRPPDYAGRRVLAHDDLHCEHLLLDPRAPHRVTGLLDWSDVTFTDPATDFATIFTWGGEALLRAMLGAYGDVDDGLPARARHSGRLMSLLDWTWFDEMNQPEYAERVLEVLDDSLPR